MAVATLVEEVHQAEDIIQRIEAEYGAGGRIDRTDGLSVEYADWRFNLRSSNTEPVLRLNVEARGDRGLLLQMTNELLVIIRS